MKLQLIAIQSQLLVTAIYLKLKQQFKLKDTHKITQIKIP